MPLCSLRARGPPSGAEAPLGRSLGRRPSGPEALPPGQEPLWDGAWAGGPPGPEALWAGGCSGVTF